MGRFLRLFLTVAVIGSLLSCQNRESRDHIRVATAANMQFAIAELADTYSKSNDVKIDVILGSSGKLAAQIVEGAPFDLFLSADVSYANFLKEKGFLSAGPETYAYGSLVVWSTNGPANLEELAKTNGKIALPNPELAPYGKAAKEALEALGLFESLLPQLVYGESVTQSNQFIVSGNAVMGFTAKSVVMAPSQSGNGAWQEVATDLYQPIEQTASIILRGEEVAENVLKFHNYLFSEEARGVLKKYGYILP